MSLVNKAFVRSERALLLSGHLDTLTVLDTSVRVRGRLDVIEVIDPNSELGPDPRMQTVFRVLQDQPALSEHSLLTNGTNTWKVLPKRENNAATVTIDYWLEQQL
jgi:hypothetical protein